MGQHTGEAFGVDSGHCLKLYQLEDQIDKGFEDFSEDVKFSSLDGDLS